MSFLTLTIHQWCGELTQRVPPYAPVSGPSQIAGSWAELMQMSHGSISAGNTEPPAVNINVLRLEIKMLDMTTTQFDSFLFWRQPIQLLDLSELEDLGISLPKSKEVKPNKSSSHQKEEEDLELSKYSTFNYWKEPIASIDTLDFSLLL
ncbi:hypothetical protein DNTS_032038 [Danionella cerebrum]|uniref:Protein AF1q n=1 Tax=Danionella cerebrum TaxID=2873325 RepID=A0A553P9J0_9TELE|nr:hypothetical protein DNTS_032038 [Danionella translucida]